MCDASRYPQEFALRGNLPIDADGRSDDDDLRVLILRDRERVSRKAFSGRTVPRMTKPSGRAVLRTRTLEAERDIGWRDLRVARFDRTERLKADWFERRQECSSEHVVLGPASAHLAPLLLPSRASPVSPAPGLP